MQSRHLEIRLATAFGLAFDVERTPGPRSGFRPTARDVSEKHVFAHLRLEGFAAAIKAGFADVLVIAGGDEARYRDESPPVNRASATREMLVHDYQIDPNRVRTLRSQSDTGGNIAAIKSLVQTERLPPDVCGLATNLYHLPRAHLDLSSSGLFMRLFRAEALWLLEAYDGKTQLIPRLGGGILAERYAEEVAGIADKLRGTYRSRSSTAAISA